MTKEKTKEVAVIDFEKFSIAQLPELKGKKEEIDLVIKANPIVEIVDNSTYELAKKSRTAVKTLRTSLQREQADVKKKIKEFVLDVVDGEYSNLVSSVKYCEELRQNPITAWEDKKEQERLEKVRLEELRVKQIKEAIQTFKDAWIQTVDRMLFDGIENFFGEFEKVCDNFDRSKLAEYEVLFDDAILVVRQMADVKIKTLTEQENIRIAQIELEKEKERQRIENERIAEEQRIAKEKFDREQAEIAEKNRIAQEKFLAEKKEFEEKQAKEKQESEFEIKIKNRIIELVSYGLKFDFNTTYTDGNFFVDILDIKTYDDEKWEKLISDIIRVQKNIADKVIIDSVIENTTQEVEFEDYNEADVDVKGVVKTETKNIDSVENWTEQGRLIEKDGVLFDTHLNEVFNPKNLGLAIKETIAVSGPPLIDVKEVTWESIYSLFQDQTQLKKDLTFKDAFVWLSKNYNVPTKKD